MSCSQTLETQPRPINEDVPEPPPCSKANSPHCKPTRTQLVTSAGTPAHARSRAYVDRARCLSTQ